MDPMQILQLTLAVAVIVFIIYLISKIYNRISTCGSLDLLCYFTGEKTTPDNIWGYTDIAGNT